MYVWRRQSWRKIRGRDQIKLAVSPHVHILRVYLETECQSCTITDWDFSRQTNLRKYTFTFRVSICSMSCALSLFWTAHCNMRVVRSLLLYTQWASAASISKPDSIVGPIVGEFNTTYSPEDRSSECVSNHLHPSWAGQIDYNSCAYAFGT